MYRWRAGRETISRRSLTRYRLPVGMKRQRVSLTVTDDKGQTGTASVVLVAGKAPVIRVHFAFDSSRLGRVARHKLALLRPYAAGARLVAIPAHTDSLGSRAYNRALGLRRAGSARRALLSRLRPRPRRALVGS